MPTRSSSRAGTSTRPTTRHRCKISLLPALECNPLRPKAPGVRPRGVLVPPRWASKVLLRRLTRATTPRRPKAGECYGVVAQPRRRARRSGQRLNGYALVINRGIRRLAVDGSTSGWQSICSSRVLFGTWRLPLNVPAHSMDRPLDESVAGHLNQAHGSIPTRGHLSCEPGRRDCDWPNRESSHAASREKDRSVSAARLEIYETSRTGALRATCALRSLVQRHLEALSGDRRP